MPFNSSIQETRRNDAATARGASKAKQRGGNHLLTRSTVAKCKNKIPRHVQTASMGLLQMPMDKLGQNRELRGANVLKYALKLRFLACKMEMVSWESFLSLWESDIPGKSTPVLEFWILAWVWNFKKIHFLEWAQIICLNTSYWLLVVILEGRSYESVK